MPMCAFMHVNPCLKDWFPAQYCSIGGEICFFLKKNPRKMVVTVTVTTIKFKKLAPTPPDLRKFLHLIKQPNSPQIPKNQSHTNSQKFLVGHLFKKLHPPPPSKISFLYSVAPCMQEQASFSACARSSSNAASALTPQGALSLALGRLHDACFRHASSSPSHTSATLSRKRSHKVCAPVWGCLTTVICFHQSQCWHRGVWCSGGYSDLFGTAAGPVLEHCSMICMHVCIYNDFLSFF